MVRWALPSRRRAAGVVAALLFAAIWRSGVALAHGPCGCLEPRIVQAGAQVRVVGGDHGRSGSVGFPAYRIVFNPRPADLGIAPTYLAGAFRADGPSKAVLTRSRTRPTRRGRFRVPEHAPPGLYMVLIFDGDEGGAHNSWEYLHVFSAQRGEPSGVITAGRGGQRAARQVSAPPAAGSADASDDAAPAWPFVVGAAIGGAALGLIGGARLRRSGA